MNFSQDRYFLQLSASQLFNDRFIVLSKPKEAAKTERPFIIAGYASVIVADSENHIIPVDALVPALQTFMAEEVIEYRNVMVGHSSLQVGKVIPEYKADNGRVYKTSVDNNGLFVVIQLRSEKELSAIKGVREDIVSGKLRSFSIAGIAKPGGMIPGTSIITLKDLELFEITICEQGKNPLAKFDIIAKALNSGASSAFAYEPLFDPNKPLSVEVSKMKGKTSLKDLYAKSETLLSRYMGRQEAAVLAELSKPFISYVDLEKRINYTLNETWNGVREEFEKSVIVPACAYGTSLTRHFPDTTLKLLLSDEEVEMDLNEEYNPVIIKLLLSDIDVIGNATRRMLMKSLSDIGSNEDILRLYVRAVSDHFERWRESNGRIQVLSRYSVTKALNGGILFEYGKRGSSSVRVIDNDDDIVCKSCSESDGQIWSLGQAMVNLKQHPRCRRIFVDAKDALPTK